MNTNLEQIQLIFVKNDNFIVAQLSYVKKSIKNIKKVIEKKIISEF